MTLVRERRHQQALKLSLPPQIPAADLWRPAKLPALSFTIQPQCPNVENFSKLEKLAVLGHGNGATIYKVRHPQTASIYALKVLHVDQHTTDVLQQAGQEAEILKRVDSPLIVKCHAVLNSGCTDSDNAGELYFLMEYMEGGSLQDILCIHRKLPEQVISRVARRVLEGLCYLHSMKIVHRDIKPSNLLINSKGELKIADFGVSQVVASTCNPHVSYLGTCAYMSPERFDPERWDGDKEEGFAGDVWSLGIVLLECHVGHYPLISPGQTPDWATLMCAICFSDRLEIPETASPEFKSFVSRCLEKDWRARGTVDDLLHHPFVNKSSGTEGWFD